MKWSLLSQFKMLCLSLLTLSWCAVASGVASQHLYYDSAMLSEYIKHSQPGGLDKNDRNNNRINLTQLVILAEDLPDKHLFYQQQDPRTHILEFDSHISALQQLTKTLADMAHTNITKSQTKNFQKKYRVIL